MRKSGAAVILLKRGNTRPFMISAVFYCLITGLPFLLFLSLRAWPCVDEDLLTWWCDPESNFFIVLTRFSIFSAVMAFGGLGAAISLITRVRALNDSRDFVTLSELHTVQTVGAVFALILSLMFMGELVAGTLFPNSEIFYYIIYIPAAFAKLLVWSFIAGFSERFVPTLIHDLSKRAEDKDNEVITLSPSSDGSLEEHVSEQPKVP